MDRTQLLLQSITSAQARFVAEVEPRVLFDGLLEDLLQLSESEYGFIGEVLQTDGGEPYLKTHAITNIAWSDETRKFYEENAPRGLEFFNLDTLFGAVLRTGASVIANEPAVDPRRGGLPEGHPPLNAFLGLPFYSGREFIGMVGVANREGGYDEELVGFLAPFLATCANVIEAYRAIRRRRHAEEERRHIEGRLRATLESLVEGIITIDETGTIRSVNPAVEGLFGYGVRELLGRNVSLLMPSPHRERHDEYLQSYLERGEEHEELLGTTREVEGLHRDGRTIPLELSLSTFEVDGRRMFTGVLRDITQRKEVDHLKTEFVSIVSHELRTPLTSIRGSLGLLDGGVFGELPAEAQEMIRVALSNSDRLVRLINDILDLEKIESRRLELRMEAVSSQEVVEDTLSELAGMAHERGVRLVAPAGEAVTLRADPDRLVRILTNLVSNAIKHSEPGSEVEVRVRPSAGRVRFSVVDRGSGIPASEHGRIFEKFHQVDSTDTRARGGTGLGLSIAKALVEQHRGRIWFESEVGEGSEFHFELPLSAQPDGAQAA